MNIVSIMIELIDRQKITRRHSHDSHIHKRSSLLDSAINVRFDKKRFSRSRGRLNLLKDQPVHRSVRKNTGLSVFPFGGGPGKSGAAQKIKTRKRVGSRIGKLSGPVLAYLGNLSTKVLITAGMILMAGVLISVFIVKYIDYITMYDNLVIHEDVKIDDVLYESLPSDYDGQGSGEIMGIEPVLLTSGEPVSYIVQSGDTLSEISKRHNIKIGTLISFNKITDVRRLQVGMELKIPGYDGIPYEVKAGDSLSSVSKKYNISINSILDANDMDSDVIQPGEMLFIPGASMNEFDYKKAMGTLFIYPTSGRLSSGFGYRPDPFTGQRRFHNGIDLANEVGTRVVATMSGRVVDIGDRPSGYGKYVIIKHSNGYQSLYGHFNKVTVRKGQYVYQGDKLGEMGNSGRSTGPHLHFSIYKNNIPVNPLTYLW